MRSSAAPEHSADGGGSLAVFVAPDTWRAIDFISDLHLAQSTPLTFAAWAAHLRHADADAVFILGDLFEAWIGDDMAERGFERRCVAVLKEAASRLTIGFMAGNRDFLLGDTLLVQNAVMRLPDPMVISAFGTRVMVSHGDALCTDDRAYQRYRRVVRLAGLQRAFVALPYGVRRSVGRAMRRRSNAPRSHDPSRRTTVDLDPGASMRWLRQGDARTFIHGHTHAPATHALAPGIERHVLSDWDLDDECAPRAEVLRWTAGGFVRNPPER